jgi:hypothetical protein
MTAHEHHQHDGGAEGYFVRYPRDTDAIGESLRYAFNDARSTPDDLKSLVAALYRVPRN